VLGYTKFVIEQYSTVWQCKEVARILAQLESLLQLHSPGRTDVDLCLKDCPCRRFVAILACIDEVHVDQDGWVRGI